MTALHHHDEHPAARAARVLDDELASIVDVPLWSMPASQAAEVLVTLARVRSRLDAFLLRVLHHAEVVGVGSDSGARSAAAWWAHETRVTRAEAARLARLGVVLEEHGDVASALGTGEIRTDQARAVVDAVDALPDDLPEGVAAAAKEWLLAAAGEHDAKALRVLGRRVLEVVDPAAADAEEARRLESEEEDARAAASFTMVDDGYGRCHGRFSIPSLHGAMLRKQLLALAAPGRQTTDADAGRTLSRHRMGLAFLEYVESRPGDSVPSAGGVSATLVVTLDLDTLMGGLRAASLDTGERISAGEARRLACRAGIIPIVMGGPSVVLDVGRRRRLHSEPQRIALGLRDGGCTAAGCDVPPGLCHAHHDVPWSRGGGTSLANGRLLCPRHHRLVHDPAFQHSLDKHGKVRFSRRT